MKLEEIFFNNISDFFLTRRDNFGEVYAIGGYLRDKLLNKFNKDLDFVVKKNSIKAAREIADFFGGDFYLLDKERETARALIPLEDQRLIVDIALINGEDINEDLKTRDFSINAIAININEPDVLIDPLGGQKDLQHKKLVPCSESSFSDDPVRTLRAVRFIQNLELDFDLNIEPAIISASKDLKIISSERIRDEVCQILGLSDLERSYELMTEFRISDQIFPEIKILEGIAPKLPHVHDVLTHSFRVVENVRYFLDCIFESENKSENDFLSEVQSLIDKNRKPLFEYLKKFSKLNFSIYPLMALAGLYHDSAKPYIKPDEDKGKIVFPNHAKKSAEIVCARMKTLAFSNEDINFVKKIIKYHMSVYFKSIGTNENPNRDIYRYFQDAEDLGILLGLFHLADIIATYEDTLPQFRWKIAVSSVEKIFDAWFNHFEDVVSPARLVTGDEIMKELGVSPGRKIGLILDKIREEQAAGKVPDKAFALSYAKKMLSEMKNDD